MGNVSVSEILLTQRLPRIAIRNGRFQDRSGCGVQGGSVCFRVRGMRVDVQQLTGCALPYTQFGKPHKATYDFAEKLLRRHVDEMGRDGSAPMQV